MYTSVLFRGSKPAVTKNYLQLFFVLYDQHMRELIRLTLLATAPRRIPEVSYHAESEVHLVMPVPDVSERDVSVD